MHWIDLVVFVAFVTSVIAIGLWKSTGEQTRSDHGAQEYFLAGRGLVWWLIGFSLIAANISTEQFVGMSGQAANWLGMAIASYEWMAAITLVVVAFLFLPTFLRSGIYTIPEFLEYRYNVFARSIMAICTMTVLVGVPTASVVFSGAKVISVFFQDTRLLGLDLGNITVACWIMGFLAAVYVFAGGLKACAWADLIQGAALILGGTIVLCLAIRQLGMADPAMLAATAAAPGVTPEKLAGASALARFWMLNDAPLPAGKLHMVRPLEDPSIPWTALVIGLWIPNFYYWGLNQYITQRTLGSKSLAEGQKGIVFAAFLKLLIPFVVVIPGILAYNLFRDDLRNEAIRKNADVMAQFQARADKIFRFNLDFAKADAALALELTRYNAAKLGINATALSPDPQSITQFNNDLVGRAKAQNRELSDELEGYDYDAAFPTLLRRLLPQGETANGLAGFVLAAIFGAVVSSLAAMLNSASTIATMDIYHKFRKRASQYELVTAGRVFTVLFVLMAILIAPHLGDPQFRGIFTFIQEFQGFISPGILAIFLFGLLVPRAPRIVGIIGLIWNPSFYAALKWFVPGVKQWAFLDRMALCFGIVLAVLTVITILKPLPKPVELPVTNAIDLRSSPAAKRFGLVVVGLTLALYIIFW
ncbi:MAG: sodium/solute symporter [Verrucomicrobiae bacterium]|nr:sodium/solute symporter [Verrucomicrobiae bacterium]